MQMFDKKQIVENGENGEIEDVLIAPVGEFIGSSQSGEPVEQNFTQQSLERLAEGLNQSGKEILCDADHASAKSGLDRNTRAVGWFSKFVANASGLFGLLKLTKWGREMIENREYRSVSPVFRLNKDNEPVSLLSVASTNTPAIEVPENTILNTEPSQTGEEPTTTQDEVDNMTREEIIELIKEVFNECSKTAKNECGEEKEEVVKDDVLNNTPNTPNEPANPSKPKNDEPAVQEGGEGETNGGTEVVNASPTEVVTTEVVTEDEHQEVITEEVLNSTPTTVPDVKPNMEWKQLSGTALNDWISKHREEVMQYQRDFYASQTH